jgi:hypothetical protein
LGADVGVENHGNGMFAASVGLGGDLDWRLCKKRAKGI